jgi:hypothetical protein
MKKIAVTINKKTNETVDGKTISTLEAIVVMMTQVLHWVGAMMGDRGYDAYCAKCGTVLTSGHKTIKGIQDDWTQMDDAAKNALRGHFQRCYTKKQIPTKPAGKTVRVHEDRVSFELLDMRTKDHRNTKIDQDTLLFYCKQREDLLVVVDNKEPCATVKTDKGQLTLTAHKEQPRLFMATGGGKRYTLQHGTYVANLTVATFNK